MKTKFSMFVVLCLLLTLFTGCLTGFAADMPKVEQMYSYDDVKEGHWSYPWVTYMTNNNYIHGYPAEENDGLYLYKPDQFITRGEFVTILYFMLKPQGHMTQTFTDMTTKHWSYPYVDKAVANGYLSGYGDGTVRPDAFITREEASSVVYRAFKIEKYTNETDFVDKNNISSWAYEAIMSLADLGIIVGYTGEEENSSYVQPKVNIKRAEVAALLANADKFYPASVSFSDATVTHTAVVGGKLSFDMFPKNTSDSLSVAIDVEPDTVYTVSYNKNGEKKTVTAAEFADMVFTAEEIENLDVTLNFPDAKAGDKLAATVSVTDKGGAIDRVVGSTVYEIEFERKQLQGGGGGGTTPSVVKHTVTYKIDGNTVASERVENGNRPANIPTPEDKSMEYVWIDEASGITVNPALEEITGNRIFTTTTITAQKRDRVVESLKGYQAMKGKGLNVKTVNVLSADEVDSSLAEPNSFLSNKWWTNDMLEVIVTNDRDNYADMFDPDKSNVIIGEDEVLKPIYDDVARYVVDNNADFETAPIDSTTKRDYVLYFRAMVATIKAAADDAVQAYQDARASGTTTKEAAYELFLAAAVTGATNSLNTSIDAEALGDGKKTELKDLALGYLTLMVEKAGGLGEIKTYLESVYGDPNFDNLVKAKIASTTIYAK
ncbi:MAG: S-layer homology domain-containing protein [Clostridia bacterium]|nr:S-layer homology domain-containing protein [Clostridia bacterium]MBQ8637398.1 S-layer homology domain-containing protein [Clostridia bacterium]